MGWLKRLFGLEHQDTSPTPPAGGGGGGATAEAIAHRVSGATSVDSSQVTIEEQA